MIPYEYKTYKLMVLPHSTWVDTSDHYDHDDEIMMMMMMMMLMLMLMMIVSETMIVIMMMMMMMTMMIVSVEQRPGWAEHV